MVLFANPFPVVLALLLVLATNATPTTHRTHYLGANRSLKLEAFHPKSTFEGFGVNGVNPLPAHQQYPRDTPDTAMFFLASKLGISEDNIKLRALAQGQVAQYAFLVQKINGLPVANAVANIAFNNNGMVTSFGSSFVNHSGAADIHPSVSLRDAIATAEKTLDGTYNGRPATLEFVVQPNGFAALTHVIQIQNETKGTWYEAFVDAHKNTVLSVTDFVAKASYLVIPVFAEDSNTMGFYNVTDPQVLAASPNGWHQEFTTATNMTDGNNAIAYTGDQLMDVPTETSPVLNFNYVVDPSQDPTIGSNVPAAITNAFFVVNAFHDFAYLYGFTETTFNFQSNNFDKGGEEFDRVLVSVQDIEGIDGADFAILPDGQSSKMRLFLYEGFYPRRDSALQNEIIIHECMHGAANRMTGGGTARCFQTLEATGVSEGYADAMADAISQNQNPSDYVFGKDVSNNATSGLRTRPYSTSR